MNNFFIVALQPIALFYFKVGQMNITLLFIPFKFRFGVNYYFYEG
jgi:hypothetical protein